MSVANRENTEKHKQKIDFFFNVTYIILRLFGLVRDYNFVFYLHIQVSLLQYLKKYILKTSSEMDLLKNT